MGTPGHVSYTHLAVYKRPVHVPHPFVIGQKGGDRRDARNAGVQGRASQRQSPALGTARCPDPAGIDLGLIHNNARQLRAVEENGAKEQVIGIRVVQSADNLTAHGVAHDAAHILGSAALLSLIHI